METLVDETENSLTPEKLINVFSSVWQAAHAEEKQSQMDYRRDEYLVLTGAKEYARNTNRFDMTLQPREHFGDTKLASVFQNITLLNQLEVISVLKGYSRIRPIESDMMLEQDKSNVQVQDELASQTRLLLMKFRCVAQITGLSL